MVFIRKGRDEEVSEMVEHASLNCIDKKVRVAVIGAGWWTSRVHIPTLLADSRVEIVGICDTDSRRAKRLVDCYSLDFATDSIDDILLEKPDCVIVATSQDSHYEPAKRLIECGCDVLVEKPMTLSPAESRQLKDLAARHNVKLHVGYPMLHSHQVEEAKRIIHSGGIGKISLASAFFATAVSGFYRGDLAAQGSAENENRSLEGAYSDATRGGGHLYAQATHPMAMLIGVTGERLVKISAFLNIGEGCEVDDTDVISALSETGTLFSVATTGLVSENEMRREEYRFVGDKALLALDTVSGELRLEKEGNIDILVGAHEAEPNPVSAPAESLVDCWIDDRKPVVDGSLGSLVTEALWAAAKSSKQGMAINPNSWVKV